MPTIHYRIRRGTIAVTAILTQMQLQSTKKSNPKLLFKKTQCLFLADCSLLMCSTRRLN
jgi:hypothetical protein